MTGYIASTGSVCQALISLEQVVKQKNNILMMPQKPSFPKTPKLLDQVRNKIRLKHYSYRTEQTYVDWIKRFILHHGKRHPRELGAAEVEAFLTHLAVEGKVSASRRIKPRVRCFFCTRRS